MVPINSPGVVSYSTFIDAIVVSVTALYFDIKPIFPKEQWCKLIPLPVWRTRVFRISTKNNRHQHLPGLYLGGKFVEDRWRIVICRAFNSFRVTD